MDRAYIYDNSIDGVKATRLFRTVEGIVQKVYGYYMNAWAKKLYPFFLLPNRMDLSSSRS